MTTESLSGLALMNIHYEKPVNYDAVVQLFAEKYPRRMLLVDPSLMKHKIENKLKCSIFPHSFAKANLNLNT